MAKKNKSTQKLGVVDIVMGAEAEVIKAAYEARVKIDDLLAQREKAYREIHDLEKQVENVIGEEDTFAFPPPPYPVAGFTKSTPATRRQSARKTTSTGTGGARKASGSDNTGTEGAPSAVSESGSQAESPHSANEPEPSQP